MCLPLAADGPAPARGSSLPKSLTRLESGGAMPRVGNTYTLPACLPVCTCKRVFKRTFISSSDIITLPRGVLETLCSSLSSQIPPSLTFSPPVSHLPLSSEQKLKNTKNGGKLVCGSQLGEGGSLFRAHSSNFARHLPTPPPPSLELGGNHVSLPLTSSQI